MTEPRILELSRLEEDFCCDEIAFLGRSSFEDRSFFAFSKFASCNFIYKHFFHSADEVSSARELRAKYIHEESCLSKIDTRNPLETKKTIEHQVEHFLTLPSSASLVVDISTFRREELLILLRALLTLPDDVLAKTTFVYSTAPKMGQSLSKNVRQVRPVVGFPGEILPRRGTHLVILAGIEYERAISVVEAYEPTHISLGSVPLKDSLSIEIYDKNAELRNYFVRHFEEVTYKFYFPAIDPASVVSVLKTVIARRPNLNTVIAPLNTKLSTIGCGIFASRQREIQLCYAEVEMYNVSGYSVPGGEVLFVPYFDVLSSI